jgi:soluble lytic murein transglycosylase
MKMTERPAGARAAALMVAAACLAVSAVSAATETDAANDAVRGEFRAAYAAAATGGDETTADSAALRDYVLYPYLRAARIERRLARADGPWHEADAAAEAFLGEAGNAAVARALRRAWLTSLARRASWEAFLKHYDAALATTTLECQRFSARIARQDTVGLAAAVRTRWLTGQRLPTECEPAFQWLRAQGELPDDLVAQRATLLLDNGQAAFARVIAARLPAETAAPLLERADFVESPARALDAMLRDEGRAVPATVVLEAWSRLARNSPAEALARYDALAELMPAREQEHALALMLAKGLAWDRQPAALDYFERVPREALDATGREWWARAAMWSGEWDDVRAAIAAMPAQEQTDWPWLYWAGRAAAESGDADSARTLLTAALAGDNYYSAMAAARLDERIVPRLEPIPLDAAAVESLAAALPFRRVRELALVGLRDFATSEWRYAYSTLPADAQLQAVHLAARWEIHDVAVATATSHGRFNDYSLLYPRPHADAIAAAVKLTEIEPQLLYGVIRQESLFRADAASSAGALGLAQLMPGTARATALRWQLPAPQRADLFDPNVNITLAAAHVAELLQRFDAALPVALGAYNAGEAAAARWLPADAVDSDVWVENIPYNETRAYVRRVLWHSLVYRWLETGEPQSTRGWVGKISGAAAAR